MSDFPITPCKDSNFESLFRYNLDAVFLLDAEGRFADANEAGERLLGCSRTHLLGRTLFEFVPAPHKDMLRSGFLSSLHGEATRTLDAKIVRTDGGAAEITLVAMPLTAGGPGAIVVAKDKTLQNQALRLVAGQNQVLEMIATTQNLDAILHQMITLIEEQSGAYCSVLLLDKSTGRLNSKAAPSMPEEFNRMMVDIPIGLRCGSCGTAAHLKSPVIVEDIDTDERWDDYRALTSPYGFKACWSVPIMQDQDVVGTFAMYYKEHRSPSAEDLTMLERAGALAGLAIERQRQDDTIRRLAFRDALTGLANRRLLEDSLDEAILAAEANGTLVALLFLDLDRFKIVNDSMGHRFGDLLLRQVSDRLLETAGEFGVIARQGGDEFVLLLAGAGEAEAIRTAEMIVAAFKNPFYVNHQELFVTPSIGISVFPTHGGDPQTLLKNADYAMYQAKQSGRNGYRLFDPELQKKAEKQLETENHLRRALDRGEMHLLYQPQVDMRTGRVIGVEALIRWHHTSWGLVPPASFIPLAEETGLILPIGDWVLNEACRQAKAWLDEGLPPMTMSVNISARQFQQPDFVAAVEAALRSSGFPAHLLEVELTESYMMDKTLSSDVIHRLKRLGVGVAIDDFGTGYSSLHYLKHLSIDRLKIDQSFVRDLLVDQNDQDIVKAILTMSHSLGIQAIAEGVELPEQAQFLRSNGCDQVQGYLFAHPLPASAIPALVRAAN